MKKTPKQRTRELKPLYDLAAELKTELVHEFVDFIEQCQKKVKDEDLEEEVNSYLENFSVLLEKKV